MNLDEVLQAREGRLCTIKMQEDFSQVSKTGVMTIINDSGIKINKKEKEIFIFYKLRIPDLAQQITHI